MVLEVDQLLYELRVQLQDLDPPIWRIIHVPSHTSMSKFHRILQRVMGWKNYHQHAFQIEGKRRGQPSKTLISSKLTLEEAFSRGITSFVYEYDFGDGWRHEITLLGTLEGEGVKCISGARACPPEDCGGPPGYYNLMVALSDPDHEEHEDMMEWVGGKFDPSAFDVDAVNRALKRLR